METAYKEIVLTKEQYDEIQRNIIHLNKMIDSKVTSIIFTRGLSYFDNSRQINYYSDKETIELITALEDQKNVLRESLEKIQNELKETKMKCDTFEKQIKIYKEYHEKIEAIVEEEKKPFWRRLFK